MREGEFYVGARKNKDGSVDLSQAATFKPKDKNVVANNIQETEGAKKIKRLFKNFENGGGSVEMQEAENKLVVLKDEFKNFMEGFYDSTLADDVETKEELEKEIEIWERVANGEKLMQILEENQTAEDEERIKESREKIKKMKQL